MEKKDKRILVVDDLSEGRALLANVLKGAGYEVITAENGLEAMEKLEREQIDIIISDILMPKMDGFQFCRAVRSQPRFEHVPFIFYTASYADRADENFALSLGANRFVIKPIEPFGFLKILKAVLEEETKGTRKPLEGDAEFLAEHNARLIQKLEKKLTELEEANEKLQLKELELKRYSEELERLVEERTRDLRESQARLSLQEKLSFISNLAGELGHELRNPLSVIGNGVYYLRTLLDMNNEEVCDYLEIISTEVQNAHRIIYNLLDLTRIGPAAKEYIKVNSLVMPVLEGNPAPENVRVEINLRPDLPEIFVDPGQISQVVKNILTNAYRAMPEGGSLTIFAQSQGDMLHLSFADTGCGIAGEMLDKIFEPRVSFRQHGLGLGLALARILMEINGGGIRVVSEVGKGSTFTLVLPCEKTV